MADNEFTADLVTIEDEDGVTHTFEELDRIETDDGKYLALTPVYDDAEEIKIVKYKYLPDAINIRTILTQHLYFRGSDSDAVEQTSRPFGGCWEHEC